MSNIMQLTFGSNQAANLPGGLDKAEYYDGTYTDAAGEHVKSVLRPPTARAGGRMVVGMVKALLRAAQVQNTTELGGYAVRSDSAGAVEYTLGEYVESNDFVTIQYNNEPVVVVAYEAATHKVYATKTLKLGERDGAAYELRANQASGAPLFFSLMPLFLQEPEFSLQFPKFCQETAVLARGGQLSPDGAECLIKLCDNMYYQLKSNIVDADLDGVSKLVKRRIDSGRLSADMDKVTGRMHVFVPDATTTANRSSMHSSVSVDPTSFRFAYAIRDDLTDEEKAAVPSLPHTYCMPKKIVDTCELIQQSQDFAQPFMEVLLHGPPGSGKTEGAKALAVGLGLPYFFMLCHAHAELYDLLGTYQPADSDEDGKLSIRDILDKCPDFMQIAMEPAAAYHMITGRPKLDATEGDCLYAIVKKASAILAQKSGEQKYVFRESDLVKAMRKGYLLELMEPSTILNSGVLPGLNSLLDTTMSLKLSNHNTLVRHPKSVFVATTNFDLEGCRQMNQAFYSRFKLKVKMETPQDDDIIARVKALSGYDDDAELANMLVVMKSIQDRCELESITDGSIGVREFTDWAMATRINNDPYKSALVTIIPSASTDERNQSNFVSGILQQHYPATAA